LPQQCALGERPAATQQGAIYESVMEMLKDGQQIFKDDEAIKRKFTFSYLTSIFQGEGSASLKGYVTNNVGQPIPGATIISADQKYSATTGSNGYYKISRVAEGTYTFIITCPGYSPVEQVISFAAGTASNVDVQMTNLMKKAA
jgi:Carboxypeptidase regulatory-like domain